MLFVCDIKSIDYLYKAYPIASETVIIKKRERKSKKEGLSWPLFYICLFSDLSLYQFSIWVFVLWSPGLSLIGERSHMPLD
ncbi:hypothetical protein K2173_009923 [Erythroxylum novogranatense]|uniref:Uncharacterized protein n=1 Tax=Erythroxylum novogranatense TaxID=1862640 RepID=A0AAV8SZC3_9ROSI|nr:hypothetical protein K2173_009923 [Erythroxylum novogranatense]